MKMTRKRPGLFLTLAGLLLMAAALALVGHNLRSDKRAESRSRSTFESLAPAIPEGVPVPETLEREDLAAVLDWGQESETEQLLGNPPEEVLYPDYMVNPTMDMPVLEHAGFGYVAILEIPALELELPVMGEETDEHLQYAPCRYYGTPYMKNMVISAHNYQSHFGRIHSLVPGDEVTLTDMDGNVFRYEVAEIETLRPTAVEAMKAGEYPLTLFTCTVGGQSRVTVRCAAID